MANTKSKRHTHKYHAVKIAGDRVWACGIPSCYHYMPTHMKELVIGRASVCWKCDEEFVLNTNNMKNDKPICDDCNPQLLNINEYLDSKGVITLADKLKD